MPEQHKDNDLIHVPVPDSIYVRTDYIVNSDMSIPLALARSLRTSIPSELERRVGLPPVDRTPHNSPVVLAPPRIPNRPKGQ